MKTKKCSKCETDKPLSDFYSKGKENRLASYCKQCFNQYCMQRWIEKKKDAVKYKGGCCKICQYSKSLNALEFHHRDKNFKEFEWNKLRLYGKKRIYKELDKCDLLCSNCHREAHDICLA